MFRKNYGKGVYFFDWLVRTISTQDVVKLSIGPAGKFFLAEGVTNRLIIAENDDQLRAKTSTKHRAVFVGKISEMQVKIALDEGKVSKHGEAPGAGWERPVLAKDLEAAHQE